MDEAQESDPNRYSCFNDFFCRSLKEEARPLANDALMLSPADGAISQAGKIEGNRIFQAKGRLYSTNELLAGKHELAEKFIDGNFATIYLSPKDYHRLHMPISGTLVSMTHVPGDLFSVNPSTTDSVPSLFARNERVICIFDTSIGEIALILVGAMIVASIETTWAGLITPTGKAITHIEYQSAPRYFEKGEEFARFKLGSTIIILAKKNALRWCDVMQANQKIKMGERIATP